VSHGTMFSTHRTPHAMVYAAWSPDGQHIATGDSAGRIQIWQADTGQQRFVYKVHTKPISSIAWSPDGTHLVSSDRGGLVTVWEALTGKTVFPYQKPLFPREETRDPEVAWSPDGRFIAESAVQDDSMTIQVRSALTGGSKIVWSVEEDIAALSWSPGGEYLASGDAAGTVHLWDPLTGQEIGTYVTPKMKHLTELMYVNTLAWSPDGRRIAFGDTMGVVQVWDVVGQVPLAVYRLPGSLREGARWDPDPIQSVAWLPDGERIGLACRSVHIREAITGQELATYAYPSDGEKRYVRTCVDWSPDRQHMVSVGSYDVTDESTYGTNYEGAMYVWEVEKQPPMMS